MMDMISDPRAALDRTNRLVEEYAEASRSPATRRVYAYGLIAATCLVSALEAWLRDAGITVGPTFRPIDRHGNVKRQQLTAQGVFLRLAQSHEVFDV